MSEEAITTLIRERTGTHGTMNSVGFAYACLTQNLTFSNHVEALMAHAIAHKIARITSGDPRFYDHWYDIAGYVSASAPYCNMPEFVSEHDKTMLRLHDPVATVGFLVDAYRRRHWRLVAYIAGCMAAHLKNMAENSVAPCIDPRDQNLG